MPDVEQRLWRTVVRRKHQVTRTRVQLQNRLECLLEEAHLKLSRLVSDLFGTSARRMLQALADGETNPATWRGWPISACGRRRTSCAMRSGPIVAVLKPECAGGACRFAPSRS